MNEIEYTYKVIAVNSDSMEIEYKNAEHGIMIVGARLPYEGESLQNVADEYSPALLWEEKTRPKGSVTVGEIGSGKRVVRPSVVNLTPEEALEYERSQMVVSRLQGRLTLGPEVTAQLDQIAEDPNTPWAMGEAIKNAGLWYRTSESMTELAYLLEYTDEDMDDLFRSAATLMV